MSCKRIPQANRKGRGRIKYDYDDLNKLSFDKVANSDSMGSKTILQEDNQDVIQSSRNGESSSELEISESTNFSLSSQPEIESDIAGVNVEDWLKPRPGIDLDAVMKGEVLDTTYLNDILSNKDVDMTCIVTNICDLGLGLDLPTNTSSRSKHKPEIYIEKDCDNIILHSFSANQDPMLNDLTRSDLLDTKDILDENTSINNAHKDLLDSGKCEKQGLSYEGQFIPIDCSPNLRKQHKGFKENLWNGSEITDAQTSIEVSKDRSNWESLSTTSKRSVDADSEKEIDFPEFNLITFQIDNNDAMCNVTQFPQVESNNKEIQVPSTTDVSEKTLQNTNNKTVNSPLSVNISENEQSPVPNETDTIDRNISSVNTGINSLTTNVLQNTVAPVSNPRSLLKSPIRTSVAIKKPSILKPETCSSAQSSEETSNEISQENQKKSSKKTPSMAIIAISTDKSKNTTEIVINTPYGEQVFKGKTTDLMKATTGLWQKLDSNIFQKSDQPLTISTPDGATEQSPILEGDGTIPLVAEGAGDGIEEGEEFGEPGTADEDKPVADALADLGISVDKDIFFITTAAGQKLWACPIKGCERIFQRQSMLKVHILSHFNVRPYKCNFTGCHWSFYTYFKLRRHKETHLKRKDFVCPINGCGRRFTTIYNLNTHQKLHERPLEMICPVEMCAARFQTKRSLELHMKTHDKHHAPYKCSYDGCGKHYYSLNSLNSHSRSHQHKEEEVRCQWKGCGKLFDKPCRLKAHMRSHTGDKPYSCTYRDCGWAFSSASKLKRHQHKHTNERKFQCGVEGCGKSFMRSEHLKEHALTHIGQRNFQCPYEGCGVKFSAKSSLYVHVKKHNKTESETGDKVVYHCPIEKCIRTYTCKSSLRHHMLKFHTPILATDPSQLDYIALLTGDDELATLEGLQFSGDMATAGGISSLNAISLVTPPSILMSTDGMGSVPSEFISTDNQNSSLAMSNASTTTEETSEDIDVTTDQALSMALFEPVALEIEPSTSAVHGSARTSYTYQDIVRERDRRKGNASPTPTISAGLRDDLTNHQNLYSEDQLMTVSPGVGEFQVLLLDPSSSTRHEFAESTINLRDLE
ncbi:hypothetical protein C0J52_00469 [Blattella germanica]|nr:hypothetical protein C0J52_00469 [Blattella germanica]